ncbi:hypothetical protein Aeqsu_2105 [Aequorivita sublithincola DSM 14238]|uniref:Uncharacterized protein n=1 Tax=Aequorivita sublithincola (strain DSM 14238 / LMG 21431 / ACAM 643 / 9-3) TaxID=746697 RepID=I3YX50_AEQSU|nr:hypothetical protein [Aequorivita sublithincola]AFL81568.1 hypothetical protein Aeqsu_2105 [Aequorivita sublithincola DSM 14238]
MEIFQHIFKTLKMIKQTGKILLILLLINVAFTSCNNKKNESTDAEKEKVVADKKEKTTDATHSFDITLVKGSETIEFSETVPSKEGGAIYNDQKSLTDEQGGRNRTIMMFIGKKYNRGKAGIFGIIRVDENLKPFTNVKRGDKSASTLSIRPKDQGDEYNGISGTMTFSDLKYVLPMPMSGAACFTLNFEGEFQKNGNKEDIYHGSGTIVISPEKAMGVYKKK